MAVQVASSSVAPSLYQGLELSSPGSIRLLTLRSSKNKDGVVSCSLRVPRLRNPPVYTALSYVWGSPNRTQEIMVNGHPKQVTENLYIALKQLRKDYGENQFWIDALCINQDDAAEKAQQVALMRDIYLRAENVVVWLGEATKESDSRQSRSAIADIASREYWTRAWVIQEFVLPGKVILRCGDKTFDWGQLFDQFSLYTAFADSPMWDLFAMKRRQKGFKIENFRIKLHLLDAIQYASKAQSSDPRDKVYAMLGLAEREEAAEVTIDYRLSPCEVYCQALQVVSWSTACNPGMVHPGKEAYTALAEHCHRPLEKERSLVREGCDGGCGALELLYHWPYGIPRIIKKSKQGIYKEARNTNLISSA